MGRLYNAAGGALPPEHREWVRQDLTGPGWRRRMVLRPVLLAVPFSVLFMAVPGSLQLRIPIAVGILVWTAGMSLAMSSSFRNRRLRINGLPPVDAPGSAEDVWDEQRRAAAGTAGTAGTAGSAAEGDDARVPGAAPARSP